MRARGPFLVALAFAPFAAGAYAEPARDIHFAESANRRILAFVFGHKDSCRVIRRSSAPRFSRETMRQRRRFGAGYKGEPGDKIIAEFDFGRQGRPVHLVPTNDGRHLLAFANRSPDGAAPTQDRAINLTGDDVSHRLDYSALPEQAGIDWPELPRALPRKSKDPPPPAAPNYAFVTRQSGDGPVLVARRTEWKDGHAEIVCFAVEPATGRVTMPAAALARRYLDDTEPLVRAGASRVLGQRRAKDSVAELKGALSQARDGAGRAAIAWALVRCGDETGRRTLRALLQAGADGDGLRAAVESVASLEPAGQDGEALAGALLATKDLGASEVATTVGQALLRLGEPGLRALLKASRAPRPEARVATAFVLGRSDDAGAERRLLALARDGDVSVATAAARALIRPPRRILEKHHPDFARCLDHMRRSKLDKPAAWLCVLAAQAKIKHDKVLKALVDLAPRQKKAIWSLRKLTGDQALKTAKDCRDWWRKR